MCSSIVDGIHILNANPRFFFILPSSMASTTPPPGCQSTFLASLIVFISLCSGNSPKSSCLEREDELYKMTEKKRRPLAINVFFLSCRYSYISDDEPSCTVFTDVCLLFTVRTVEITHICFRTSQRANRKLSFTDLLGLREHFYKGST